MSRPLALLSLALVLAACGASPRRQVFVTGPQGNGGYVGPQGNRYTGPQGNGGGGGGVVASGDSRAQLGQLDQLLRQRGYSALGPAIHGSLAPNGLIAYAVAATPGACYAIFALGDQPGQDLNLTVTDPSARTIAYDVRPDSHPYAVVCPGVSGRLAARLQMLAGEGGYYYAVYQGPSNSQPDLAAFFGAGQAAPQVQSAQLDQATNQRITAVEQRLTGERFRRVYGPIGIVLSEGMTRQFPATLQAGTCYAFASFGGPGAADTDITLVDGSGNEIERDVETAADGMIRYCPTAAGAYNLVVKMYTGNGPLFTLAYQQGAPEQGAQQTQVVAATSTATAGLEENFRLLDGDMRARGYENMGDAQRGQLAEAAVQNYPIELEGGKCYAILAVGDNGVRDLDLLLVDGAGATVDRDVEQDPRPIVRVCPTRSGSFRMQVKMFAGAGNFVYGAYRWPRGVRGPFGLAGLMYVRLAEVTQLLSVEGFQPDADFTPARGTFRREGEDHSHTVALRGGMCYSVLVVGGDGVNDIEATLLQGTTPVANDGTRNAFPSVRHCPTANGNFSLKVKAVSGSGAYFYQLFTQTQ